MVIDIRRYCWSFEFSLVKIIGVALLLVSCGGGGGDSSPVIPPTMTPASPVAPLNPAVSGEIRHAPGALAQVFWDTNDNWEADTWETSVTADATGRYVIAGRPIDSAVLRAKTTWLAPSFFGNYDGPLLLSAIKGKESVVSPFTSLAQIGEVPVSQIESDFGLSENSSPSNLSQVEDIARAVSLQLQRRKAQLALGEESAAASAIVYNTKQLIRAAGLVAQSKQFQGNRELKISSGASSTEISALALQSARIKNFDYAARRVAGFDSYAFTTKDQRIIDAVNSIFREIKQDAANKGLPNPDRIHLDDILASTMRKWAQELSAVGLGRDAAEIEWDADLDRRKRAITETFTDKAKWVPFWFGVKDVLDIGINVDLYLNATDAAFGAATGLSGVPVNKAYGSVIQRKVSALHSRKLIAVMRGLNCAGGVADVVQDGPEAIVGLAVRLSECLADGSKSKRLSGLLKSLQAESIVVERLKAEFGLPLSTDPTTQHIALVREIADTLSLASLVVPSVNFAGALDYVAATMRIYADSAEIVGKSQGNYLERMNNLEEVWKREFDQVDRQQWAWKIEYRLSKVLTFSPASPKTGATVTCLSKPPLKQTCVLGVPVVTSQSKVQATTRLSPLLRETLANLSDPIAEVHVSFGDGWSTDNLPEYAGKTIRPGDTVDHSYYTTGRYTVVATTRFSDGDIAREETAVSVDNQSATAEQLRPLIRSVFVTASIGSAVSVQMSVTAGGANQFKNARVDVTPFNNETGFGETCALNVGTANTLIAGGTYRVSGCTVAANTRGVLIEIYAQGSNNLTAAPYQTSFSFAGVQNNGSCGSANGVSVTQKPSTNLCSAGSTGSVSGSGPWTWTCSGTGGGSTASCSAPLAAASSCIGTWDGRTYQVGAVEERFTNTCPVGTTGQVRNFHTCQAGGTWSALATSDTCRATLLAPSSASVASVNSGLQVTWSTVAGATGYNIYRGGSLRTSVFGGLTSSSIDSGVTNGVNYCYAVEAISSFTTPPSVSIQTSAGCATFSPGPAPLLPPANVSASQISGGGLRISWSASTGADGYVVTRQNDGQTWDLSSSTTSYNDLSVTSGISYAYVVQAKRGTERSPQSTQANAIAPSVPVNGVCGSANGVSVTQKPSTNLCSAGSTGSVSGSGPWTWTCSGTGGGSTASCSAPLAAPKVSDFTPKSGSRGRTVVLTVTGTGLSDTVALGIENVTCANRGFISSTTSQQFDCEIPTSAPRGKALVVVKDRPSGNVLFQPSLSQGFEIK